jgi:hypothetical protein
MSTAPALRYEHSGSCKVIVDARQKPTPDISIDDCYFLGFRLTCEGTLRFHHAWIIANDHEAFLTGLRAEGESLSDRYPDMRVLEVDLVFMHNLRTQKQEYLSKEVKQEVGRKIGLKLNRRDDEHFAVLGIADDKLCEVVDFRVKDALMAIRMTRSHSLKICGKKLVPLAVCQAHPVNQEFDMLFHQEAKLIYALLCTEAAGGMH